MFKLFTLPVLTGLIVWSIRATAVSAGTIRHDVSDTLYRNLAQDTRYESVGNIEWVESGITFWGSATLIHPEWLLTGAHIVDGTDFAGGGITSMKFEVGDSQLFPDLTVTADQWIPNPGWTTFQGNLNLGFDIGLVHLSTPITTIQPAKLYEGRDEKTQIATFVGYGRTGTGLTGSITPSVVRRAGNQVIDNFGGETTNKGITLLGNNRIFYTDFDSPNLTTESKMGSTTPLPLEFMTASGDSGGGIFIEDPDTGETVLAGVHSFGSTFDGNNNSDYGDASGTTRVSSFISWIESHVPFSISGDFDGDGFVGLEDLDIVLNHWNQNVTPGDLLSGDGDDDGFVGLDDLDIILNNWNTGTPPAESANIPEPTTLCLLVLGCVALSKRRQATP